MAFFIHANDGDCCDDPCSKKEDACDDCGCPCDFEDIIGEFDTGYLWVDYKIEEVESDSTTQGCTKKYYVAQSHTIQSIMLAECKIGDLYFSSEYDKWTDGSNFHESEGCGSPFGLYKDTDGDITYALVRDADDINCVIEGDYIADYNCDECVTTVTRTCEEYEMTEQECADYAGLPLCDDVEKPCDECNEPCCTGTDPVCAGSGLSGGSGINEGSGPVGSGPCCEETNDCCPQIPCCPDGQPPCGGQPCCDGSGVSNAPVCGSGVSGSGVQGSGCCEETNSCDPDPCCDEDPNCECDPCYDDGPCTETLCEEESETVCENGFTEPPCCYTDPNCP